MQYPNKDLYDDKMDWVEFTTLLNGLTAETPLGRIIQIRSEDNQDIIDGFTQGEREIYNSWQNKQMELKYKNKSKEEVMKDIQNMFKGMFS